MYTTVNEEGVLNNYPVETKMEYAEYPAIWEQRRYVIQGAVATVFVAAVVWLAFVVS
jgi:hypothetical protein